MRVLVTGARGMLGAEVVARFRAAGLDVQGTTRAELDITRPEQVRALFDALRPNLVVHCAAMTNVDACERQPQDAYRANAFGAEGIASHCQRVDAACVYISTDYVFDGAKGSPYHEYDAENPLSVYGKSKFAGEQAVRAICPRHYIVRVAWLYGKYRKSFPQFVVEQARAGGSPTVISDQIGSPTYTADVADRLLQLVRTDCYGVYHMTNASPVSRYEFAETLLGMLGLRASLTPLPLAQWQTPAPRPRYCALTSWRLEWAGVEPMPPWQDALQRFVQNDLQEGYTYKEGESANA